MACRETRDAMERTPVHRQKQDGKTTATFGRTSPPTDNRPHAQPRALERAIHAQRPACYRMLHVMCSLDAAPRELRVLAMAHVALRPHAPRLAASCARWNKQPYHTRSLSCVCAGAGVHAAPDNAKNVLRATMLAIEDTCDFSFTTVGAAQKRRRPAKPPCLRA